MLSVLEELDERLATTRFHLPRCIVYKARPTRRGSRRPAGACRDWSSVEKYIIKALARLSRRIGRN